MDVTPFPSGATGPDDLVVYYKPGCPFAIRLRAALTFYGVPFTSVRIRDDEAAAAKIRAVADGCEISPTVRIGATFLPNPTVGAVRRARRT